MQDVELLGDAIRDGSADLMFDLDRSNEVERNDLLVMIKSILGTWIGDANLDREFNSSDLVMVFRAGKFEQDVVASWSEGDWNGDSDFDTSDLVIAFTDGGYEQGPPVVVNPVPEPASCAMFIIGLIGLALRRRRTGSRIP